MKILIIEDELVLSKTMVAYLQKENYHCDVAYDFKAGRVKMESFDYDCVLLDISLPDGNGLQLLKELKENNKLEGVIIISAKNSLDDRIAGLNLGADDYMPKPFHLSELCARIAAVIRRKRFHGNTALVFNELIIDLIAKTIMANEKPVELTRKEFDLLLYLVSNKNRVVSKNAIAENLSGDDAHLYDNFDFIYAHMKNLKRKLTNAGCQDYIKSIYGMGYKFTV
ncbi:MAG: response regulator transcription factor [Ferruginibacter sp.]